MTLRSPTREDVAVSVALVVTLAGIAALAWPVRDGVPAAHAHATAAAALSRADGSETGDSVSVAAIARANIFSDRRQARTTRDAPAGPSANDGRTVAETMSGTTGDSGAAVGKGTGTPRLFGIVAGPDGPTALMRLDGVGAAATPYHVGDRSGSFRVVSIGDREVVVDGPGGRRTVRLFAPSTATKSP